MISLHHVTHNPSMRSSRSTEHPPPPGLMSSELFASSLCRPLPGGHARPSPLASELFPDIYIGGPDELLQGAAIGKRSRTGLHMSHEPATSLQEHRRIRKRCAVEEPDVDMCLEDSDVTERGILDTCRGMSIVQKLSDIRAAFAHPREPFTRNGGELRRPRIQPPVDLRLMPDGPIEPQKGRGHSDLLQRLFEIGDQIVRILDAHRDAEIGRAHV